MTLSNITTLSSFTDNAPASPAYMNAKFAEVEANFQRIAAIASAATSVSSTTARWGNSVSLTDYAGDWGQRVALAQAALGANGGTIDGSALTGAQSLSGHLTLNVPRTRILVGNMVLSMGNNTIHVTPGTNHVSLIGENMMGGHDGGTGETYWQYTGAGSAVSVGGPGSATNFFRMSDIAVNIASGSSEAVGLDLRNTQTFEVDGLRFQGPSTSSSSHLAVRLDGTGGFTGHGTFRNVSIYDCNGYLLTGSGAAAANANTWLNGSLSGRSWLVGVKIDGAQSNGNTFIGTDIENYGIGLTVNYKWNNFTGVRFESNKTDFQLETGAIENWLNTSVVASNSSWTDLGDRNVIILQVPGNPQYHFGGPVRVRGGSALAPTMAFTSETSLGWWRSAGSTIALSYGTADFSAGNVRMSSTSSLIGAFVVQGSSSSFTIITWSAVKPNDIVWVTPTSLNGAVSSLSSGIVAHSHCTQAGQVELRLSNVSTLAQNVSSKTWYFTRITPF